MMEIEIDIIELEKYRTKGAKNKKKKVSKKSLKDVISDSFRDKKVKPEKERFPWESTVNTPKVPGMYSVK